jgi:hypothetical protein
MGRIERSNLIKNHLTTTRIWDKQVTLKVII